MKTGDGRERLRRFLEQCVRLGQAAAELLDGLDGLPTPAAGARVIGLGPLPSLTPNRVPIAEARRRLGIGKNKMNAMLLDDVFSVHRDSDAPKSHRFLLEDELMVYLDASKEGPVAARAAVRAYRQRTGRLPIGCNSGR